MVTATVDIVQWYCVLCGVYCAYSNSNNSAMVLCCVWGFFVLKAKVDIVLCHCVFVEFIVVTATVDIVKF